MRVAIIGAGNMGKGLINRLKGKAELVVGVRDAAKADLPGVEVTDVENAVAGAEIVVLALPYAAALEFAGTANLEGKIVVDITNPVTADFSGLAIGHSTSAGEEIQKAAKGAKVVKAYNTIFAQLFAAPVSATLNVPVFLSGNDEAAVDAVAKLVALSGFAVENTGGLDAARLVEPLGMLNIRFGYGLGRGVQIAPGWSSVAA